MSYQHRSHALEVVDGEVRTACGRDKAYPGGEPCKLCLRIVLKRAVAGLSSARMSQELDRLINETRAAIARGEEP